ncbi:ABC transporter substrate-binding protein [Rubrivivax gelatinosus]|uniref:ABC transporter substrate-binding protein n=1 Tax=Rubrivivax gelatinosus TaxID=28068 RepID=A0ABS1DW46_RUBGE|nr:acyclic terpene utilization AtuA family protein [Rubrivivax gelatinosus]MBK1613401.1 ABC transporter substrate-binding protein [Rubrivivax gelatinosus]MBK1714277.1 ABC transporter substrate-binding protein [Rubrivivax gelatinosus]
MKKVRIGAGAGYSGDRIEPAVELAAKGNINYLVYECLAERTIGLAQQAKMKDPKAGYDALLEARMRSVLALCQKNGITLISNMGAANPIEAVAKTREIAASLGLTGLKIAAVSGDDVLEVVKTSNLPLMETGESIRSLDGKMVSANAYLGVAGLLEALKAGANVIITGRVADPALFMAPLIHEFGWKLDDWDKLGKGTLVGHLLECGGQITGGYFADPGVKDVDGLARLGFPIAEVSEDGTAVITKVEGSGGKVVTATCKEQMLYEIHDPRTYFTPDVVADFSNVKMTQIGPDQVRVEGATGRERTSTLKVSVGYRDGYIGEGQMSYAGPGAQARGELALEIVEKRLALTGAKFSEIRYDLIGVNSIHTRANPAEPGEVRVRVAARTATLKDAVVIGNEVETLYTNGPAAGGGATKSAKEVLAILSVLLPRESVKPVVSYVEV